MDAQNAADVDDHEVVRLFELGEVGAHAVIAIHSAQPGPAIGGCLERAKRAGLRHAPLDR